MNGGKRGVKEYRAYGNKAKMIIFLINMKRSLFCYLSFLLLLIACGEKNREVFIHQRTTILFRQTTDTSENRMDSVMRMVYVDPKDSDRVVKKLVDHGFVKKTGNEYDLLADKIIYDTAAIPLLKNEEGRTVQVDLQGQPGGFSIAIKNKNGSSSNISKAYSADLLKVKYKLIDIIPGGYPEIMIVDHKYVADGYEYELTFFEVTSDMGHLLR